MDRTIKQKLRILGLKLLGGRPMSFVQMRFVDTVTGKMVNLYADVYGRLWLATDRWGWDRERWPGQDKPKNTSNF